MIQEEEKGFQTNLIRVEIKRKREKRVF